MDGQDFLPRLLNSFSERMEDSDFTVALGYVQSTAEPVTYTPETQHRSAYFWPGFSRK